MRKNRVSIITSRSLMIPRRWTRCFPVARANLHSGFSVHSLMRCASDESKSQFNDSVKTAAHIADTGGVRPLIRLSAEASGKKNVDCNRGFMDRPRLGAGANVREDVGGVGETMRLDSRPDIVKLDKDVLDGRV